MRPIFACGALCLCAALCACSGGDKDSFRNVDHDKNGKISYEELLFVFPDVRSDDFVRLDTDGDGSLSEEEYKAFLKGDAAAPAKTAPAKTAPAPAAPRAPTTPPSGLSRPGDPTQMAVPYRGEEVIEIPAPGSESGGKAKPDKGRKDAKETRDAKPKAESAKKGDATQYTVQRGDNLSRIAHKFGIGVDDITRANGNMNPDTLRDGQVLNIPARP
ncbi:LysM peptidoglycan-binding domain-containing protein [Solidesulfovibrio sp.]|uniref:LysM peptidoglycan-binding domain-containing protein n=1 Tax=Solidesulfovibrio sp. TaxID=2910990 RepID=UPI0026263510|nr:LysM peptidoglycan-binding domain-containing protein [Solidesulfovibrio sp.]